MIWPRITPNQKIRSSEQIIETDRFLELSCPIISLIFNNSIAKNLQQSFHIRKCYYQDRTEIFSNHSVLQVELMKRISSDERTHPIIAQITTNAAFVSP